MISEQLASLRRFVRLSSVTVSNRLSVCALAGLCTLSAVASNPSERQIAAQPAAKVADAVAPPIVSTPAKAVRESRRVPSRSAEPPVPASPAKPEPAAQSASTAKEAAPPAPEQQSEPPPAEPAKDEWSNAELIGALQECLKLLGPIAAEIDIAEPPKKGSCGIAAPVALRRLGTTSRVDFRPPAMLNCKMVVALNDWIEKGLQPAAREALGTSITAVDGASGYSCRNRYNLLNDKLSEHALGNAIDIAGFATADGRSISVLNHWGATERDLKAQAQAQAQAKAAQEPKEADAKKAPEPPPPAASVQPKDDGKLKKAKVKKEEAQKLGATSVAQAASPAKSAAPPPTAAPPPPSPPQAQFLRRTHQVACRIFGTVLGPEANDAHRNHFHLDLAARRRTSFCQ